MAKFGVNDADKYGGQGGGGYFSLKNDRDTATVRFLIDGIEDVSGYAVHEVDVNGKKRYVNCLRDYGQPMDVCPCCARSMPVQVKYFIPLFNLKENRIQTWERGKKFGQQIASYCSRYPHLVSHKFDIERQGEAGSTQTQYQIFEVGQDDTSIKDFDNIPDPLGTIILNKTADELEGFMRTGRFDGADNSQPVVRRGSDYSNYSRSDVVRRTPMTNNGDGRNEVF